MNDISYSLNIDVTSQLLSYDVYVASKNDTNIRYLNIALFENGNAVPLSENASATASFVTNGVLIDEDIACTIDGNIITVPLTDLQQHGNLDIQVTVTDGSKILATPYPIQVKVTPNIAETAQIDENSMGSYAEVVQEIATARDGYNNLDERLDSMTSETAATYERLTNKSQTINPTQQSDDNVKYPSVNAARNYTNSKVATLRNYVNGLVDSLDFEKADKTDVYTKTQVYNKSEANNRFAYAETTYSKTETDHNISQAAARKESLSHKVQSISENVAADDDDNYPSVNAARSYTNGKFTNLKDYVDGKVGTLNSAKADKTDVYTKTQVYTQSEANGRFEVKENKVAEINSQSTANQYPTAVAVKNYVDGEIETLDSAKADKTEVYTKTAADGKFEVKDNKAVTIYPDPREGESNYYPSVTAVRNYVGSRYSDMSDYVDEELDSLNDTIQEGLNGKEDKANKVTEITDGSTANQYPTVAAAKNYTDSKVEESEQYFPDMVDSDITAAMKATFVTTKFVKRDGTIGSNNDFERTAFFDISGYKKLKIHTTYGYQAVMVAFYSGQTVESFIDFYGESPSSIVEPTGDIEVEIPEGASYAIINCLISAESRFKVIGVYEQEVTIKNKLREIVESQSSYEIIDNKASEITPQALSSDNVRYPSVTAARNYTNSKYNDLQAYADGKFEAKTNKVAEIKDSSTAAQYPIVAAVKNYTDERARYHYDQSTQVTPIALEVEKDGYYINTSSSETKYTELEPQAKYSKQFNVAAGETLIISTKYGYSAPMIVFYDSNGAFLSCEGVSSETTVTAADVEVTVPANAAFAALNCLYGRTPDTPFEISRRESITIENKLKQVSDKADCITDLIGNKIYVGGDSIMYGHGSGGYAIGEYLSEKYSMELTKGAVTGATLSTSFNNSICTRMCALEGAEEELKLVGDFDVIIFDGGVNDKSRGYELGALTNNFEDNFDTAKVIGALEKICRRLVLDYPSAKKLFIISNEMTTQSYSTNKSQIEYMEALIPVLNKWGIPYVNMLHTGIKAFNEDFNDMYFSKEGAAAHADRLHPNRLGYETFYFEKIEQALLFGSTDSTTAKKETSIAGANIRLSRTNFVYDGSSHVPNVSAVTLNGQTLTPNVDYVVVSAPATNAGDYVITINGMGNYSGTATANWTIGKAQATISGDDLIVISGVGNALTKTYTTNGDGAFSFSLSNNIATLSNTGGAVTVTAGSVGSGNITVSVAESQNYLGATKNVSLTIDDSSSANVFGVVWDYSLSSPELTRLTPQTDPLNVVTAVPTQEPTACIGTEGGQSDFDNYMPWAGMQRFNYVNGQIVDFVDYANGETYVYIPEFWSKIVDDSENSRMYFYISDSEVTGFTKHLGSGRYVARYPCGTDYKSIPNSAPTVDKTINEFRTALQAKDIRLYVSDIHTYEARQLLTLVEWANFNSQDCIGMGIVAGSIKNSGATDILTYHTGRVDGTNNQSAIQYRWVENPWGNVWQFVDGVLVNNYNVYICNNVNSYGDSLSENYIDTEAILPNAFGYVRTLSAYNNGYIFPQYASGASDSTYICDYYYGNTELRSVSIGGTTNNGTGAGLFFWSSYDDSSTHGNTATARPMLIPNTGGNG